MKRTTVKMLLFILLLAGCAAYIDWPQNPGLHIGGLGIHHPLAIRQGLDLQGGVRILLEPDPAQHYNSDTITSAMSAVRDQIEQRVNGGLGVSEPNIRVLTSNGMPRISVELPAFTGGNQSEEIKALLKTGNLEFWNTGPSPQGYVAVGTKFDPQQYTAYNPDDHALFSGKDLDPKSTGVGRDEQTGRPQIQFAMQGDAVGRFATFTRENIGTFMTITLDREVIQSATINSAITGPGVITGQFSLEEAQRTATILRYGSLPIVLTIASQETIGPTLGEDSLMKSALAGAIGLSMVILFMLLYYRLPGLLADLALILYAALTFAVYKLIGVTLTLAGIAGFILSIGMAVDANVLIFERIKEELRDGRTLSWAIELGWKRAWLSIRDSNLCTMLICVVLYIFGSNFGATSVIGFATTLLIGVLISLFTSMIVTRTLLHTLAPTGVMNHPVLFGLPARLATKASEDHHSSNERAVGKRKSASPL